jgi:hypothetical protein
MAKCVEEATLCVGLVHAEVRLSSLRLHPVAKLTLSSSRNAASVYYYYRTIFKVVYHAVIHSTVVKRLFFYIVYCDGEIVNDK